MDEPTEWLRDVEACGPPKRAGGEASLVGRFAIVPVAVSFGLHKENVSSLLVTCGSFLK